LRQNERGGGLSNQHAEVCMQMILPIAIREIRVAAHAVSIYRSRVVVGAFGILLTIAAFSNLTDLSRLPPYYLGQVLFSFEGWAVFAVAALAGFSATSDSISREKRNGTLGLLFLTQLRGWDVVLGKLASTCLKVLSSLITLFPVMSLPLLMGGIQFTQIVWLFLSFTNVLLFSASVGLLASSFLWKETSSQFVAILTVGFITAGLPVLVRALKELGVDSRVTFSLGILSPFFVQQSLFGAITAYKAYWCGISAGITLLMSIGCLAVASWCAPRFWQIKARVGWREILAARFGRYFRGKGSRTGGGRELLDSNPYLWLAIRNPIVKFSSWGFLIQVLAAFMVITAVLSIYWDPAIASLTMATPAMILILGGLKVRAGGNSIIYIGEAKENGVLELLLASDLTIDQIIEGQFMALRKNFRVLLLASLPILAFLYFAALPGLDKLAGNLTMPAQTREFRLWGAGLLLANVLFLYLDTWAITWVGLYCAFRCPTLKMARALSGFLVLLLPWFLFGAITASLAHIQSIRSLDLPNYVWIGLFLVVAVGCELIMARLARRWLFRSARAQTMIPPEMTRDQSIIPDWLHPTKLWRSARLSRAG